MPEIITKHPDIVLKLLQDTGAKCAVGAKQQILTACPKEDFCALPKGELCIYNIRDISRMTQLNQADFAEVINYNPSLLSGWNLIILTAVFLIGLYIGAKFLSMK